MMLGSRVHLVVPGEDIYQRMMGVVRGLLPGDKLVDLEPHLVPGTGPCPTANAADPGPELHRAQEKGIWRIATRDAQDHPIGLERQLVPDESIQIPSTNVHLILDIVVEVPLETATAELMSSIANDEPVVMTAIIEQQICSYWW
jgi:hypothetical protein